MLIWILLVGFAYDVFGKDDSVITLSCPSENMLPRGIGSRGPFFGDVIGFTCYVFKNKLYGEKTLQQGVQSEEGITAKCDKDEDVIVSLNLRIEDSIFKGVEIECAGLLDPEAMKKMYSVSSDEFRDLRVVCETSSAVIGIHVEELEDGVSRVSLDCVTLEA